MTEAIQQEPKKKGFDDWEIENALSTLTRAEEIKKDPKLMAEVEKRIKKLNQIVGVDMKKAAETLYKKGA